MIKNPWNSLTEKIDVNTDIINTLYTALLCKLYCQRVFYDVSGLQYSELHINKHLQIIKFKNSSESTPLT